MVMPKSMPDNVAPTDPDVETLILRKKHCPAINKVIPVISRANNKPKISN